MGWLYEPKEKDEYQGYIHSEDMMLVGFDFQTIMDTFVASVPKEDMNEKSLRKHINEMIQTKLIEVWENFELCKEEMLQQCKGGD